MINKRSNIYTACALSVVLIGIFQYLLPDSQGWFDFVVFWEATRNFAAGRNPYDLNYSLREIKALGYPLETVNQVWVLPQLFLVLRPFSFLPFDLARRLWFLLTIAAGIWCFEYLVRATPRVAPRRIQPLQSLLFLATFFPLMHHASVGNVTIITLISFTLTLAIIESPLRSELSLWIIGVLVFFTAMKPHLFLLPLSVLVLRSILLSQWRVMAGLVLTGIVSGVVIYLRAPDALFGHQIFDSSVLLDLKNPSVAVFLQSLLPVGWRAVRFVPLCVSGVLILIWCARKKVMLSWDYALALAINVVTSPYVWIYDFVLLIPLVAISLRELSRFESQSLGEVRRSDLLMSSLYGLNVLLILAPADVFYSFWYPPLVVIGCVLALLGNRSSHEMDGAHALSLLRANAKSESAKERIVSESGLR